MLSSISRDVQGGQKRYLAEGDVVNSHVVAINISRIELDENLRGDDVRDIKVSVLRRAAAAAEDQHIRNGPQRLVGIGTEDFHGVNRVIQVRPTGHVEAVQLDEKSGVWHQLHLEQKRFRAHAYVHQVAKITVPCDDLRHSTGAMDDPDVGCGTSLEQVEVASLIGRDHAISITLRQQAVICEIRRGLLEEQNGCLNLANRYEGKTGDQ